MRIAVPTSDTIADAVHGHVATAPYFTIVDTETGETRKVSNGFLGDERREPNPVGVVRSLEVDALLCGGIGAWARRMLEAAGIKVYRAHGGSVDRAIRDFRKGKLKTFDEEPGEG